MYFETGANFRVGIATKTKVHPHYTMGTGNGWLINGWFKNISIARGVEHKFTVETSCKNHFYLSTDPVGGNNGVGELREGVQV